MKSRGIIFRGDMVRAIREGRKTQTRRLVTLREFDRSGTPGYDWTFRDRRGLWNDYDNAHFLARKCPYGVPGDELWVRETFQSGRGLMACAHVDQLGFPVLPDEATKAPPWIYSADGASLPPGLKWRSSRFMPREASRLTLVVESVRVERLSAITEEDARAEGFCRTPAGTDDDGAHFDGLDARDVYLRAFRAMHKLAADADPWLWVVTFGVKP